MENRARARDSFEEFQVCSPGKLDFFFSIIKITEIPRVSIARYVRSNSIAAQTQANTFKFATNLRSVKLCGIVISIRRKILLCHVTLFVTASRRTLHDMLINATSCIA